MTSAKRGRKTEGEKGLSFEEAIAGLEGIVRELEGGDIPLEKSLAMFEEGVRLSKLCHQKLSEAEKKVQVLVKNEAGEFETRPFEGEEPGSEAESGGEDDVEEDDEEEDETLF